MNNPHQVYNENVGHTHDAAVQAVFAAGFEEGRATGQVVTETVTLDPNPVLEGEIEKLEDKLEQALHDVTSEQSANARLVEQIEKLEDKLEQALHDVTSEQSANALLVEQVDSLKHDLETVEADVTSEQSANALLVEQVDSLKHDLETAKAEVEPLKSQTL
jgi:chromosome segregation ATPase